MYRILVVALGLALALTLIPSQSASGFGVWSPDPNPTFKDSLMFGRSALILNLLFTSGASASTDVGWGNVETQVSGFGGGLAYQKWFRDDLAATFSFGGMDVEVRDVTGSAGVRTETASNAPFLFGLRYHPRELRVGESMFVFLAGGIGPVFGVETLSSVDYRVSTETNVEVAFGGNASAGFDFYMWNHFNVSVGAGYNLMTDYRRDIGSSNNHSGPEMGISFGWVF